MLPNSKLLWYAGLFLLVLAFAVSLAYSGSDRPVGMALSCAPLYGLVSFLIASAIARFSRRPITSVDAVRIFCWTVLGSAEGVREMARGYYAHYWPQYSDMAATIALIVIIGAVLGIVLTVICFRPDDVR